MGWWGTITGAELVQKVDEFSGVLGEVVLGLHNQTKRHSEQLGQQAQAIEHIRRKVDDQRIEIVQSIDHLREQNTLLDQRVRNLETSDTLPDRVLQRVDALERRQKILLAAVAVLSILNIALLLFGGAP